MKHRTAVRVKERPSPPPFYHRDMTHGTFVSIEREAKDYMVTVDTMRSDETSAERRTLSYDVLKALVEHTAEFAVNLGTKHTCHVQVGALRKYIRNLEPYEKQFAERQDKETLFRRDGRIKTNDRWKD